MAGNHQDRISAAALLVGLCPLIPIPLLDGIVASAIKRRLYGDLADERGVTLAKADLKILSSEGFSLVGCLWAIVIWPIKKLVKYVLFFLMVKECFDWATDCIHRAQMIGVALDKGALPQRADDVRAAMESAFRKYSHSPVTRTAWRQDRPPVPDLKGDYPLVKLSGWLHLHGGGGLMVPHFQQHLDGTLDAPEVDETPAVAADDAASSEE